jgi:predicted cupin superfamily sugar epimerase
MENNVAYWINKLNLQPHPEGGFYKEVFRSQIDVIVANNTKVKQAVTSIYYLLEGNDYSKASNFLTSKPAAYPQ